jgi:hypothetical protein
MLYSPSHRVFPNVVIVLKQWYVFASTTARCSNTANIYHCHGSRPCRYSPWFLATWYVINTPFNTIWPCTLSSFSLLLYVPMCNHFLLTNQATNGVRSSSHFFSWYVFIWLACPQYPDFYTYRQVLESFVNTLSLHLSVSFIWIHFTSESESHLLQLQLVV